MLKLFENALYFILWQICSIEHILMSQVVTSKQHKVGLTQELFFCRIRVHYRLHIYPLCGIFYFPWHRHQI